MGVQQHFMPPGGMVNGAAAFMHHGETHSHAASVL
jgi:hypothetical protein